jgi:hypothetical protein
LRAKAFFIYNLTISNRSSKMSISNLAKKFLEPPRYHSGPVVANLLGWQLARVLSHHGAHAMRREPAPLAETKELIGQGIADGVVIIPDFLPADEFERLQNYCAKLRSGPATRYEENRGGTGLDFTTSPISRDDQGDGAFVVEKIANDSRLLNVVSAMSRHQIKRPPQIGYQLLTMRDNEEFVPDAETILHADRHYPTIKAYYSLNGSTLENGAYVWVPRSHKLTAARLRYEYADSIRVARSLVKHNLEIPEAHLKDMGVVENHILTEPNTLVISNNFGFHRRGHFAPGAVREQIRLVFHYLEEPFYATWAWNVLRNLNKRKMLPEKVRRAVQYRLT